MAEFYVPSRGDIVWLDFMPQVGKEIAKRRPALVLTAATYNQHGLMLAVPITSRSKGYPFEVPVEAKNIEGVILADVVKSVDWRERNATFIATSSHKTLRQVLKLLRILI